MVVIECVEGFEAREWNSKSGDKHNIYVKDENGELGWLDLTTGKFHNKSDLNFGFVEESSALINITRSKENLFLGFLDGDDDESEYGGKNQQFLKEAIDRLGTLKYDGMELEINIGPSREIRKKGKSGWAKANLTVKVQNPDDIEALYNAISDMAGAMLDIETEKLLNRQS